MDEKKQIEEMAKVIARRSTAFRNPNVAFMTTAENTAKTLYNEDFRKQSVGEWVKVGSGITARIVCSQCKSERGSFARPPFCNQCGAKMKGGAG